MRVADVTKQLGITPDTVRFYTRNGFLEPSKNPRNGYKEYSDADCRRLRFILSARQLGFSVEDIGHLLAQSDAGKAPCGMAREIIAARLQEVEQRFNDTEKLLERMCHAVKEWDKRPDQKPTGAMICHLIENFTSIY